MKNLLLLFLFFAIISCSNDNGITEPMEDYSIIPLYVGNYWNYEVTNFDTLGYASNYSERLNTIISDTTIEQVQYYQFDQPNILFNVKDDGLYQYYLQNGEIEKINLLYKYPCSLGERYWVNEKDLIYARIISVNEEIEIQSVKYNCIVYDLISSPGESNNLERVYIQPGIGIIMKIFMKQTLSGKNYVTRYKLTEHGIEK